MQEAHDSFIGSGKSYQQKTFEDAKTKWTRKDRKRHKKPLNIC